MGIACDPCEVDERSPTGVLLTGLHEASAKPKPASDAILTVMTQTPFDDFGDMSTSLPSDETADAVDPVGGAGGDSVEPAADSSGDDTTHANVVTRIRLGVAWYPEHDPESQWIDDIRLMRDMGVDLVRIGEFCWSRMQLPDGTLTLDWLAKVIGLLDEHGIKTLLCTPTATPPVWVMERFPDLPIVLPDGRRGEFGGRRHYSPFHEGYRGLCANIAEALGVRFGHHPGVVGWQIDNEAGSYSPIDCSEPARLAFHRWVTDRYGSAEEVNRLWGLIFWNQEIERIDQLPSPREMMTTRNPQYLLAYNRFCMEGWASFIQMQAERIRGHAGDEQFIMNSCEEPISKLTLEQRNAGRGAIDFGACNTYPELLPEPHQNAMRLDRQRAMNQPRPFFSPEMQIGSGYSTTGGQVDGPRRLWAFESLARGSRLIAWFQWRRFRTGCEWRLTSVVERDRKPRSVYRGLKSTIADIRRVESTLLDATVDADVQVLLSYDNAMARDRSSEGVFWMEIQKPDGWHERFPLWEKETRRAAYAPLTDLGLTIDFITESQAFDATKPLIVTDLDMCSDELLAKLKAYCTAGGRLICFPGVGERDMDGAQIDSPPPGKLAPLFGVSLGDYYPLEAGRGSTFDPATHRMTAIEGAPERTTTADVTFHTGGRFTADVRHGERLAIDDVAGVKPLAIFGAGPAAGEVAITSRAVGDGQAIYLGAPPADEEAGMTLWRSLLAGLPFEPAPYRQVKVKSRGESLVFLFNDSPGACPLRQSIDDLITGQRVGELQPYAAVLVRRASVDTSV